MTCEFIDTMNLKNFRAFALIENVKFGNLTVFCGKNSAGKSSLIDPLLILRQSIFPMPHDGELGPNQNIWPPKFWTHNGPLKRFVTANDMFNDPTTEALEVILKTSSGQSTSIIGTRALDSYGSTYISCLFESRMPIAQPTNNARGPNVGNLIWLSCETNEASPWSLLKGGIGFSYLSAERVGSQNMPTDYRRPVDPCNPIGKNGEGINSILAAELYDVRGDSIEQDEPNYGIFNACEDVFGENSGFLGYGRAEDVQGCRLAAGLHPSALRNTGIGYTTALGIFTAIEFAKKGALIIIDSPEMHLHPDAQSNMGYYLAKAAGRNDVQIIVETHSDHVVNGIRRAIKQKTLSHEKLALNFVSAEHRQNEDPIRQVNRIEITDAGMISNWPKGFMDRAEEDLAHLLDGAT